MSILRKMAARLLADGDAPAESDAHEAEVASLKREIADLKRRNREYFDVIERIEKQRDEWIERFHRQSSLNMNTHEYYQRTVRNQGVFLTRAIAALNGFFEKLGRPRVETREDLMALSDKVAEDYAAEIEKMKAEAAPPVDGLAERERIMTEDEEGEGG